MDECRCFISYSERTDAWVEKKIYSYPIPNQHYPKRCWLRGGEITIWGRDNVFNAPYILQERLVTEDYGYTDIIFSQVCLIKDETRSEFRDINIIQHHIKDVVKLPVV